MKAVALSVMSLWGLLALCTRVQGMESYVDLLAHAAINFPGQLPCQDSWNCECAFKQRDCCCGVNELCALGDSMFARMVNVWMQLEDLEVETQAIAENTHISFSACMSERSRSFGPFTTNVPIPYTSIANNDGYGYNSALGVFTAPTTGVYSFSYTAYSNVEDKGRRLYQHVRLMKNGNVVASTWEDNREDYSDSGSQVVVLQLRRGCQVYMELVSGRSLSGDFGSYNTFSGYLLYPGVED